MAGVPQVAEPVESSVTLPGVPAMGQVARDHVAAALSGTPRLNDALRITDDLVHAAVVRGLEYTLTVTTIGQRARIAVTRDGRRTTTGPAPVLAAQLADDLGQDHDPITDTITVWAEISWP